MGEHPDVEKLLHKEKWYEERKTLRALVLGCGLDEAVKWRKLCYGFEGRNVVIIYGMKAYCALGFFKGALLEDKAKLLVSPGKHSQAMRQLRFAGLDEITASEDVIRAYVGKAMEAERDGLKVDFAEKDDLSYPDELQGALDDDPDLAAAFEGLTLGRQRGYVLHFSEARQSKTRTARIEKCRAKIIEGKGLNLRQGGSLAPSCHPHDGGDDRSGSTSRTS